MSPPYTYASGGGAQNVTHDGTKSTTIDPVAYIRYVTVIVRAVIGDDNEIARTYDINIYLYL